MNRRELRARAAGLCAPIVVCMLAACGGGGEATPAPDLGPCSNVAQKQWLLQVVPDWYLFPETLPTSVDPSQFATPEDLLDHLTSNARSQGRDRHWSYLTTRAADQSRGEEGSFVGYGFLLTWRGSTADQAQLFVRWVMQDSPAWAAGLRRGAEITAIDDGRGFRSIRSIVAEGEEAFYAAMGPPEAGVRRGFRWVQDGIQYEGYVTQGVARLDTVPGDGVRLLPQSDGTTVAYLHLLAFVGAAETPLRDAFDQFRAQGIRDFIIDLRYNGGGRGEVLQLLGDLLAASRTSADVFMRWQYGPRHSEFNRTVYFSPQPQSVAPLRIAFITSGSSASASEAIVNQMNPYAEVAIIGGNTYGKPVGQIGLPMDGCETLLRLVGVRPENSHGQGDYYSGLADSLPGAACAAGDSLRRTPGDPAEASTQAALSWLSLGYCETPMWAAKTSSPDWAAALVAQPRRPQLEIPPELY